MTTDINIQDFRQTEHKISPWLLKRWSPRAFSGEAISDDELMALLEAAHWAPSSYNGQPWRFIYAKNGTPAWEKLFSTLVEFNQLWVKKASVLLLILSRNNFEHNEQPNLTASFDAGAAWENLALEAVSRGLIAHGMSGFDYKKARTNFNITEDYKLEAIIAIGRPGEKTDLPADLQTSEAPSTRKPLSELVSEGKFQF